MGHSGNHMQDNRPELRVTVLQVLRQKVTGQVAAAMRKCVQLLSAARPRAFVRPGAAESLDTASDFGGICPLPVCRPAPGQRQQFRLQGPGFSACCFKFRFRFLQLRRQVFRGGQTGLLLYPVLFFSRRSGKS